MKHSRFLIGVITALLVAGCSKPVIDRVNLMAPPDVFGDGLLNPLPKNDPMEDIPYGGLLYATDRKPITEESGGVFYSNDRGKLLRLGVAQVELRDEAISWDELREVSILKSRTDKYPIRITGVKEYGILTDSIPGFLTKQDFDEEALDGEEEFAESVNAQLKRSKRKHVYVYLHGYKVLFPNPVLIATELWHFLGYDGVMVGYSWPATPSKWAYLRDLDTSEAFANNFRKFLVYLGEQTDAEEIHVIAYSAGTRMAMRAIEQLALMNDGKSHEEIHQKLRIGNLILIGSDLDRDVFGSYLAEGALDVPRHIGIYTSSKDKALSISSWLTRRNRLGQMFRDNDLPPRVDKVLTELQDKVSMIDVTQTEGADSGNGHYYFRSSPWASSDILMTLAYDLSNEQRGLVLKPSLPIWEFPEDYLQRLWSSLAEVNPDFRGAYEQHLEQQKLQ